MMQIYKHLHLFLSLLFLIVGFFLLASCSKKEAISTELDKLDSLAITNPQLALQKVRELASTYNNKEEYERQRFKLIQYKAEDKCDVVHDSDKALDSILFLCDYFEKNGTLHDNLDAHYYKGRFYSDRNENKLSMESFLEAQSITQNGNLSRMDSCTLVFVYAQISSIYRFIDNHKEEYFYILKALKLQEQLGMETYIIYEDVGRAAYSLERIQEASKYYYLATEKLLQLDSLASYNDVLGEQLSFYVHTGQREFADWIRTIIASIEDYPLYGNTYAALASYYTILYSDRDATLRYTLLALKTVKTLQYQANLSRRAAFLYEDLGDKDLALQYLHQYFILNDSANNQLDSEGVNAQASQDLRNKLSEANDKLKLQKAEGLYNQWISLGLLLLLVLVSLAWLITSQKNRRKAHQMKETLQRTQTENKVLIQQCAEKEESLLKLGYKNSALVLQHELHKKQFTQDSVLSLEDWNQVFQTVDNLYPTFREQVLTLDDDMKDKTLIYFYLIKLGNKKANIARLLGRNPSSVSRAIGNFEKSCGKTLEEIVGDTL